MSSALPDNVSTEEISGRIYEEFKNSEFYYKDGFTRFLPSRQILPRIYKSHYNRIFEFPAREDDVWISSFPKCGTTWTQEMVWNIVNNVDIATAKKVNLEMRVPFFEATALLGFEANEWCAPRIAVSKESLSDTKVEGYSFPPGTTTMDWIDKITNTPRIIKTHLSIDMIPHEVIEKKAKIIYVARNPRDACISLYHHWKVFHGYNGSLSNFFDAFISGVSGYYSPFLPHILGYWRSAKQNSSILFITFEEMKADLPGVIRKTAKFLEKSLDDEKVSQLVEHLSFNSMKLNGAVNKELVVDGVREITGLVSSEFMRKGQTGEWKTELTGVQIDRMDEWERLHLEGTGLTFILDI